MSEPLVSVIIPTYNNESTLGACLYSIRGQTYNNIEIIITDKFSIDNTKEIARKYGAVVLEDNSIRSKARNIAEEKSKGKFIFSIDSDMELTEKVIEECVRRTNEFDSIIIPEVAFGIGFWAKCKALEKVLYIGDESIEAARFFSKETFEIVEGYDPFLEFAEDWDIHQRIKNAGFRIGRVESLIRHNEGNLNLQKTVRKKYQYGKTLGKYKIKHPKDFSRQSKLIRPAFVNNWRLLTKDPITSTGMFLMKFCEFSAVYLGYINSILKKRKNNSETNITNINYDEFPFVSFIIPTYNAEDYLEKCLKSVMVQDYPKDRIEVFVIDGGSNDNTIKIADKYEAKILDNPKRDAESGKFIGICHSKGDIIALVDSDNEIAQADWLSKMVLPLMADKNISGVESQYLIKDDFSVMNRYCTRIKIVDPLARLLASKPLIENNGIYSILTYKKGDNPVMGANGFLWRKDVISIINDCSSKFEESNFVSLVIENGFTKFAAIPNIGIYHYYCDSFMDFVKKRIKIGNKTMIRKKEDRYSWIDNVNAIRFILATLYSATIIGPLLEALYQFIKTKDISWVIHPVMSLTTVLIYGKIYIENKMN